MSNVSASKIRMVIRATLVCITAFGLNLSADQVASVQLLAEALMAMLVRDPN